MPAQRAKASPIERLGGHVCFRPSLRDSYGRLPIAAPAINCWAIFGRPYGSKTWADGLPCGQAAGRRFSRSEPMRGRFARCDSDLCNALTAALRSRRDPLIIAQQFIAG